jgi:hypothetical protein
MKKLSIVLFAMLLPMFVAVAQNAVGDWMIHTSFVGNSVKTVAEGHQWVYYLSAGNLFRLDKETSENESLSRVNYLSDMAINQIYYNSDRDYLVVVYDNSNIDVILSDGSVVNMSEIKDAVMTSGKAINDVTFADGLMYLATEFGYVVIDDTRFVVKESHLYGESLTSVAQVGDILLLSTADGFYYGNADEYHEQLSSFKKGSLRNNCYMFPISDNTFFCMTSKVYLVTITVEENGKVKFDDSNMLIGGKCTLVQKTRGGYLLNVPSLNKYYITDAEGKNPVATDAPGEVCSSNPDGNGDVWAAGPQGLHLVGDATHYYVPNALNFNTPFWMTYNKEQDLLYVSTTGTNYFFSKSVPSQINTYDGIVWKDVTPEGAPAGGSYWIEFMPSSPDTYLMGTWKNGLLKVVNNEIAMAYDTVNSPMKMNGALHPITRIDRNGNIWVVQSLENEEHPAMVLPAAKARLAQVSVSDWVTPHIDGLFTGSTKRASFLSTKNSSYDIKIFTDGDYQKHIVFWNSNGEVSSSRPQQESFKSFVDQDGQAVTWTYIMSLTEDLNGNVWMGYTEGVCVFNPAAAFTGSAFSVVRPKVPRNDGTGLADRLMDGIQVNDVAVDGANRKWIATQSSGLFLVSSDGTQIIKKFNTTNSPLATNTVYHVCCNPNSNSVYLTTPTGVYEYFSDSSPAEPTYNNIYAYPNPVRPEYTGNVTIMGLMDNSLVKIADASGNVIRQLKSTGGMVTWDCCDQQGERAKTGVYFVLCSQANGSGEAVVTKIAVIR